MAITARNDLDRLTNGLAGGNVISGVGTLSGNTGKDTPGVAPNKVTQIQFEANPAVPVPAGGVDIVGDYGTLHINQDGSYSYTRTDNDLPAIANAVDQFTYTYADKNGAVSTATLTLAMLPQTVAAPDSKGLHKGTAYDDFIVATEYTKTTSDHYITVDGGNGTDLIVANSGSVKFHLLGGAGDDLLSAGDGNDLLEGGAGKDVLSGGDGIDTASYAGSKAGVTVDLSNFLNNAGGDAAGDQHMLIENVTGSALNDALTGDGNENFLDGGKGNDTLSGGAGDDQLSGGVGNDSLFGGDDFDQLSGGTGADKLDGGNGFDTAHYLSATSKVTINLANTALNTGDAKSDTYTSIEAFIGSTFNDTLIGNDGDNDLIGHLGHDTIDGGKGLDTLAGDQGNDTIHGGEGDDEIGGGGDSDTLFGDDGKDEIDGDFENDVLYGGADDDKLRGGDGDDTLEGGSGKDALDGGDGNDFASYRNATAGVLAILGIPSINQGDAEGDTYTDIEGVIGSKFADVIGGDDGRNYLYGGEGNDSVNGHDDIDNVFGEGGDDTLTGGAGGDQLFGGLGNDKLEGDEDNDALYGGAGSDILDGEDGDDRASYHGASAGVTASLANPALNTGEAKGDSYVEIEGLIGTIFADKLTGDDGDNGLAGGSGNDILDGGKGADWLYGDVGKDTLKGGDGIDTFAFGVAELGAKDTVTDFKFGEDVLQFLDVVDGAGNELQDLLDAGINASSSGTTLSIFHNDQLAITINGWTGPQITSMQDLSLALGSSLEVIHP